MIFCDSLWFFVIFRDFVTLSELAGTGRAGWQTGKREISDSSIFFVIPCDFLWLLVIFVISCDFFVCSRDFVTSSELAGGAGLLFMWFFTIFFFVIIFCDLFVIFVISYNILWLRLNWQGLVERGGELESEKLVHSSLFVIPCDCLWFLVIFRNSLWFFVISRDLLYFLVVFRDFVTWSELAGGAGLLFMWFFTIFFVIIFLRPFCDFCDFPQHFVTSSELAGRAGWRTGKREISSQQPTSAFLLIHDPNVKKQS